MALVRRDLITAANFNVTSNLCMGMKMGSSGVTHKQGLSSHSTSD
jgi:hypothetical protein